MQTLIQTVTVSRNASGLVTATALNFFTNFDDQSTQASWFYQYGNMVTPPPTDATPKPVATFVGVDNAIGNLSMTGTDYSSWMGSPSEAKKWVLVQLSLTPA